MNTSEGVQAISYSNNSNICDYFTCKDYNSAQLKRSFKQVFVLSEVLAGHAGQRVWPAYKGRGCQAGRDLVCSQA